MKAVNKKMEEEKQKFSSTQILELNIPQIIQVLNIQTAKIIEDNPNVHKTLTVFRNKRKIKFKELGLQSCSPDLNVWPVWKTNVAKHESGNLDEFRIFAEEGWQNILTEYIRNLIRSMADRIGAVISSKGHHTKY